MFVFLGEDIGIDIALSGPINGVIAGEAVFGGDGDAGKEEMDIGRAVGGTQFNGLFLLKEKAVVLEKVIFEV